MFAADAGGDEESEEDPEGAEPADDESGERPGEGIIPIPFLPPSVLGFDGLSVTAMKQIEDGNEQQEHRACGGDERGGFLGKVGAPGFDFMEDAFEAEAQGVEGEHEGGRPWGLTRKRARVPRAAVT